MCCAVVLLVAGSVGVLGDTLNVPAEYPTIQSAIDAAVDGDTVQVAGGTYYEKLVWTGKAIALIGAGAATTTVNAGVSARCLTMTDVPNTARIEGFTFTGGSADRGGGLYLTNSSPALQDNTIAGNAVTQHGGGLYLDQSSPTLTSSIVSDNQAAWKGGGMYVVGSSPTLANCVVASNAALQHGGGLYLDNSLGTLIGNTVSDNQAGWSGAGLYLWYSSPTLRSNAIIRNTSEDGGGGLSLLRSSPLLAENEISYNIANGSTSSGGGAIHLYFASPTLDSNALTGNWAKWAGGAVYLAYSPAVLTANTISGNTSYYSHGGGIYIAESAATVSGNTIAGNLAGGTGGGVGLAGTSGAMTGNIIAANSAYAGGGVHLHVASATLSGNAITDNTSTDQGAGMYAIQGAPVIIGNTIARNQTASWGGGLYAIESGLTLTGNSISDNQAGAGGGLDLEILPSSAVISENTISGNTASWAGGALYGYRSHPAITGNTVTRNSAAVYGGACFFYESRPVLANNAITENSAGTAGGLYFSNACSPTLTNDTIALNTGGGFCNAEDEYRPSTPSLANCILWGNGDYDLGGRPSSVIYSDVGVGYVPGPGNISADPVFVGGGDCHLQGGSPCINAGTNSASGLPATDKDGNPRIADTVVDMGAYEYYAVSNQPPMAVNDAFGVDEGQVLSVVAPGVLGNDTDANGNPLTAILATGPSNGSLALSADGSFTYTPNAGFHGADGFAYKASDGVLDSDATPVAITVKPLNRPPVAVDDAYSVDERQSLTAPAPGVLGNDSDPDGDTLTAILQSTPSYGTLSFNPDGSFVYTPASWFIGADTFTHKANDGALDSNIATVTVSVRPSGDTTAPVIRRPKASPSNLWPADGRVVEVTVTCTVTDNQDPNPSWAITGVSSSDSADPSDWQIVDYNTVLLWAELSPGSRSRTYTVTIRAWDISGNVSTATVQVKVAKTGKK